MAFKEQNLQFLDSFMHEEIPYMSLFIQVSMLVPTDQMLR